jgi:hypothetical protein
VRLKTIILQIADEVKILRLYAIALMLLAIGICGCVVSSEANQTYGAEGSAGTGAPAANATGQAGAASGSSSGQGTATGGGTAPGNGSASQGETGNASAPSGGQSSGATPGETAAAVQWGNECEDDFNCSFSDKENCEYGFCVKKECQFLSDCPAGTDFCLNGECVGESEIFASFPECSGPSRECPQACPNCVKGKRTCNMMSENLGEVDVDYALCVECSFDDSCNEGYRCVKNMCVPGPSG